MRFIFHFLKNELSNRAEADDFFTPREGNIPFQVVNEGKPKNGAKKRLKPISNEEFKLLVDRLMQKGLAKKVITLIIPKGSPASVHEKSYPSFRSLEAAERTV